MIILIIITILLLIWGASSPYIFWLLGRANGIKTLKKFYQDYYRNHFRNNPDPESASYAQGLSDGMLRRDFEKAKSLMLGSDQTHLPLTDDDIKKMATLR
jgi:hypothetical protein